MHIYTAPHIIMRLLDILLSSFSGDRISIKGITQ